MTNSSSKQVEPELKAYQGATLRACLREGCWHGATHHKIRHGNYKPFRAECQTCDCSGYIDPVTVPANRYDDQGNIISEPRTPRHFVPEIHGKKSRLINTSERRAYWRQKQKESRERRRNAEVMRMVQATA